MLGLTEKDIPKACTLGPEKVLITETLPGLGLLFCGWLFIGLAELEVELSPARLFSTGKYPFFFVKLSMHGPSTVLCLFEVTYLTTRSDSLCCLNFRATLLSISC